MTNGWRFHRNGKDLYANLAALPGTPTAPAMAMSFLRNPLSFRVRALLLHKLSRESARAIERASERERSSPSRHGRFTLKKLSERSNPCSTCAVHLLLPTDDTTTVTRLTRVSDTKTMCMHTQSTTPPSKLLYTKKKQTNVYKRAALFYTPPSTFCTQRVPLLYTKELHNDTR